MLNYIVIRFLFQQATYENGGINYIMCGIVGFTNTISDSDRILEDMMDRIRHRGPDAEGKYIDDDIALGHRRLSIIDISSQGDQPIFNEDSSLVIVFNGEIYNYKDLLQNQLFYLQAHQVNIS